MSNIRKRIEVQITMETQNTDMFGSTGWLTHIVSFASDKLGTQTLGSPIST